MRRRTLALLVSMALLLLASAVVEARVPGRMRGKIYFTTSPIKDQAPKALVRQFSSSKPTIELKRDKEKRWPVTLVAFFRRKSTPGPVTIWIYDKADARAAIRAKEPVHLMSINAQPTTAFVHDLVIDPDRGFNKNRTYIVHVGQIFGKRWKVYARGQVQLKP